MTHLKLIKLLCSLDGWVVRKDYLETIKYTLISYYHSSGWRYYHSDCVVLFKNNPDERFQVNIFVWYLCILWLGLIHSYRLRKKYK